MFQNSPPVHTKASSWKACSFVLATAWAGRIQSFATVRQAHHFLLLTLSFLCWWLACSLSRCTLALLLLPTGRYRLCFPESGVSQWQVPVGPLEARKSGEPQRVFSLSTLGSISGSSCISSLALAPTRQACCGFHFLGWEEEEGVARISAEPCILVPCGSRIYPL